MKLPINYERANSKTRKEAREEYIRIQKGRCYYCDMPLSGKPSKEVLGMKIEWTFFPPAFCRWPVHLHHSHKNHMTLGAVHAKCNAVLWQYYGE